MSQIKAEYIGHLGSDLMVVNAARVSFNKQSSYEHETKQIDQWTEITQPKLKEQDVKLIKYLASHNHWTPFAHPQISLRITAPIFLTRQLFKHKVGFVENEISRRYIKSDPEFYIPESWRSAVKDIKQGSSDVPITRLVSTGGEIGLSYVKYLNASMDFYKDLLDSGVAPEMARMVLPQSMMTSWYWTGSLHAYSRVYKLRTTPDAQREHKLLTDQIDGIIRPLFPVSWPVLTE